MIVGGMVTYALNQTTPPPTPALDTPILVVMDPSDRVLQYHKIAEKEFARAVKEAVENLPSKSFHK